ncbi:MAG: formyltransferase family protein [Cocleimonas sp.]
MSIKKRIIFCTYSSIYSSKVLEQLIADDSVDVVAVVNSTRILHPEYSHLRGALKQIRTSGWHYAIYLFFITDLFRWLQPLFKLKKWPLKTVHGLVQQYDIPFHETRDINSDESVDFLLKHKPDYLLAAHFNQLIKPVVLDRTEIQSINIHPSLLPSYKGVDPVFFALQDKQSEVGVTVHRMAENFDSGEIIMQRSISVDPSKSVCFYNCQLFQEGVKLVLKWVNAENHEGVGKLQNSSGDYDSWPTVKEVKLFKSSGRRLITLSELWYQQ